MRTGTAAEPILLGIFVGGRSTRMGGRAKGLLSAPDTGEPLVERLVSLGRRLGLSPVLVGAAGPYEGLALGVPRLDDSPAGIGPLGGLGALLEHAGPGRVVAIACDMPGVSAEALRQLLAHAPEVAVVAARRGPDAPWEPLFARYDAARVRPVLAGAVADGVRSFQRLFAQLEVEALPLEPSVEEALVDWDTPEDVKGAPDRGR